MTDRRVSLFTSVEKALVRRIVLCCLMTMLAGCVDAVTRAHLARPLSAPVAVGPTESVVVGIVEQYGVTEADYIPFKNDRVIQSLFGFALTYVPEGVTDPVQGHYVGYTSGLAFPCRPEASIKDGRFHLQKRNGIAAVLKPGIYALVKSYIPGGGAYPRHTTCMTFCVPEGKLLNLGTICDCVKKEWSLYSTECRRIEGNEALEAFAAEYPDIYANFRGRVESEYAPDGWTPLMSAAQNGHKDVVELLIAKGADANAKDKDGWTPLMSAAQNGHKDVVELLIAQGADVNAKDKDGWTPLLLAADTGHTNVVELLIAQGADVNAKHKDGWTPLLLAADTGHTNVVELLIAKGADVNAKHKDGWTPLHLAAQNGHKDVVELLIAKGADVNAKHNDGWTPLHLAAQNGHKDVVELLIAKGADVNAKHKDGWTPLILAARYRHMDVVDLLIASGARP
jgi:ankyrin repeat protein